MMSSVDESNAEPISMDMLEDIYDGSQSHPSINRRDSCYKIRDHIKQVQVECKGALLSTRNMGKVYTNYLSLMLMRFSKLFQFWMNQAQKILT